MALNTAHASNGVLIYAGEFILLYCDNVEIDVDGNHAYFKGNKKGRLYLTTHRMIFINNDKKDLLQSFSLPFMLIRDVELEQPVFGANYIKGKVKAQPGGNFEGNAKFKLHFKNGGAIEFGQSMLQVAQTASRVMPQEPPPYTPPTGPFYQAPPPAYTPQAGVYYGFNPPPMFATAPPAGSVFMTDTPPPYPGLNTGQQNGYPMGAMATGPPPPLGFNMGSDAKAQEAAQSAYYDPNNPHYTYVSQPAFGQAPPTYDEATKKFQ